MAPRDFDIFRQILKEELNPMKDDIRILKSDVSILKTDVNTLKADVSTLQTNFSSLETDVHSLKSELTSFKLQHAKDVAELRAMDAMILEEVQRVHEIFTNRTNALEKRIG